MRAPFVVLVIPYRRLSGGVFEYALMRRSDINVWQAISGGGEDDETPEQAAVRESFEEAGLAPPLELLRLDTVNAIAVTHFSNSHQWGDDVFVIPQYCFGVRVEGGRELQLSHEHTELRWLPYAEAHSLTHFENNQLALWELDRRLRGVGPRD